MAWPQDVILSGVKGQRISFDQLNLPQFVQGVRRNIIYEMDG